MAARSMNLLELQQSSETIAGLLSRLENPRGLDLDDEEKQRRRMSREQVVEVPQEQDTTMRMSIPSIKTLGSGEQLSESDDEDFGNAASSDSDFLEYDPDDLCGAFDSLNLAHCYENVHLLLGRFKTDAKTAKTAEISSWFQATAHLCNQSEADLEEKEAACIEDFNHLEAAYHDIHGHLEGKQVTIVQCMRRFYNKVLSLRPELDPTYSEAKRKQSKKAGFQFPTLEETLETKRKKEEQRRNRLRKEMQSHKSLEEGEALTEDQPKKAPEQASETQEKKIEKTRTRTLTGDPSQETNAAMIAQDLLALISDQQDEIAHLRSQADVNTKSTEAMKMALEYVRHERESEDAEQTGGKAKKRQGVLNDLGKEVLNDVVEQARMKCITELLVTNEGRAFLETTEGAAKMLEAHSRGQNVMEEIEELKTQMEVLQEQISDVGNRADRENQLRQTISERKRAIAMQEEADRRAIEAAAEAEKKQQQLQQQTLASPKGKGLKKSGARKTLTRSDTGLATLNEDDSNIFGSLDDNGASSEDQSIADALVGMPDLSWLFEQTPETQKQLDQMCRNMEKCMSTITAVKTKMLRALEDSIEMAVDEELERLKKEEEGIVDFGSGSRDVESVSQIKEKIKEQRRRLEEERGKTQQLEEQDLELKVNIRKLKKSQREHELEAKNKSRALGTSMAKKASQSSDDNGDGTAGGKKRSSVSYAERQKRLAMQNAQASIPEEPSQVFDENGEPLPTDIQEVRGQVRVVGKEIESLQKKEAQLQSLAEAALKRYSQASLNRARLASDPAETTDSGAIDSTSPHGSQRDLQREALQKESSPNTGNQDLLTLPSSVKQGEGSRDSEHGLEGDSSTLSDSKDMPRARSKSPGIQGNASNSSHSNATEATPQFGPRDEGETRSSSKRQSKQSQQSMQSMQSMQFSEVASSDGRGPGRSSADSGAAVVVPLESQNTVVVDKREQQVKELLFYQSENDRLQKQISGVERKIREAKLKSLNPDQHTGQVAPVIAKDATLPEENRQMRREVRQRQRELNSLRKRWQTESDKHKRGAYENNIPGQLEAALKLLLKAPPDASELQAKVEEEEEAKKRAQEEADRLASEAAAKAKEEEEELNRRMTMRSSVTSVQTGWESQAGQSGSARKSSVFQSGAHKMSVSAKELGSLFSAAAYKVQSPEKNRPSGQSLFPALSTQASPPRTPMSGQSDGRMSQSSTLSEALSPDVMRTSLGSPSRGPTTRPNRIRHAGTLAQEPPEGWQDLFFGQSPTRASHAEPEEDLAIMGQKSRLSVEPNTDKRRNSSLSSIAMFGQGKRASSLMIQQRSPRIAEQFERVQQGTAQPEDLNLAVVGQKEANPKQGIDLNRAADLITQKALANKDVSKRTLVKQSSLTPKSFLSSLANDLGLPSHDSPKSQQETVVRGSVKSSHSVPSVADHPGTLASWGVVESQPKSLSFQDALPETPATRPSLAMGSAVSALKQRLTSQLPSHGWQKMGTTSTLPGIEESS